MRLVGDWFERRILVCGEVEEGLGEGDGGVGGIMGLGYVGD